MINFESLLSGTKSPALTDPKKLFITLQRDKKFAQPTAEQGDVLDQWRDRRTATDLTIKMNTGAGKTLVGLLALQSSLNEGVGPAIYVTPDNYLAQQVRDEAALLGIAVTDSEREAKFMRGESILVTNVFKIFNGRSTFGVDEISQPIGTIVVDDAHACLATIDGQFRITLQNDNEAYREIWKLLSDRLRQFSDQKHYSVETVDPNSMFEVPFWIWQEKIADIHRVLKNHEKEDKAIGFALPLIAASLAQCQCVFSGKYVEIAPRCTPVDQIPSFAEAKRRIYMTATLANDGILITHFRAKRDDIDKPIQPKTSDMGVRMILAPQELDRDFDQTRLKALAVAAAKKRNVVVIVPSTPRAKFWEDVASQTLYSENLHDGVNQLKQKHVGVTVLVNKYDGIDLPFTACELLIIDGMPRPHSAIGRLKSVVLDGTKASVIEAAQKIEQGMGRGVRSSADRCAVILFGADLIRVVNSPATADKFTPITRAQLKLSRELAKQITSATTAQLMEVLEHSFNGSEGWIKVSKTTVAEVDSTVTSYVDAYVADERAAFDKARLGRYRDAADVMQKAIDDSDESKTKGYLKQQRAEYTNHFDKVAAQTILSSAIADNINVTKPLDGVKYSRIAAHANQAKAAMSFIQQFKDGIDLLTWVDTTIDRLSFDPEQTDRFEAAVQNVGYLLRFASQRPERDTGKGPDNLWVMSNQDFLVIECKSGATGDQIWKKDCNQLLGSSEWFKQHYPQQPFVPVMIHPSRIFAADANPSAEMKVVETEHLTALKTAIVSFAKAVWNGKGFIDESAISAQLVQHKFTAAEFVPTYTAPPGKG